MFKFLRKSSRSDESYNGQLSRHVETPELVYNVAVIVARETIPYVWGDYADDARSLYLACKRVAAHSATAQESARVLRAYNVIRQLGK